MSLTRIIKYNKWLVPILTMLLFFTLFRVVFQVFNGDLIASISSFKEGLQIYWIGFRYDLLTILLINLPILLIVLFNRLVTNSSWVDKAGLCLTVLANSLLVMMSIADIPYFRFNNRRATIEVLDIMSDSATALPSFFLKYWFFVFLVLISIFLLYQVAKKSNQSESIKGFSPNLFLILFLILSSMFIYHGSNKLTPKHASLYVKPVHRSLVTNTPITFIYSFLKGQEKLERKEYFSENEVKEYFQIHQTFESNKSFQKKNIFLFVLESFSQEYLIDGHPNQAPTPFLDSIMSESTVFKNTYANGATSAYGLMSILGGIPPFLDEAYFATIYGDNDIHGIGTLLKEKGYTNSFFYGAEDDHYGFRKNMTLLGIDNYFSKEDYKGDAFDGHWGVYDEPFMQMAAEKIKQQPKPVFSTIFNISSHLPYMVPDELKSVLPKGTMSSHQSLAYVDYSIQQFFKSIEEEEWFENSVFIFIADHWAKRRDLEFKNDVGRYRIPFFIFDPSSARHESVFAITQQLDVMPTLLDYLDYSGPFMTFGRSTHNLLGNEGYKFSINEYEDIYQIIDNISVLAYDETLDKPISLYKYKSDPELKNNLLDLIVNDSTISKVVEIRENYVKAVIQTYNNHLIDNNTDLEPNKVQIKK